MEEMLLEQAVLVEGPPRPKRGPNPQAVAAYRAAVLEAGKNGGKVPEEIIFATYRTAAECAGHLRRYQGRLAAWHDLDCRYPELLAAAAEMERQAAETKRVGLLPVAQFATVAELTSAIQQCLAEKTPGYFSMDRVKAQNAKNDAQSCRQEAMRVLQTTCDPALTRSSGEMQNECHNLQGRMAIRAETVLNIEGRLAEQRRICERLMSGDLTSEYTSIPGFNRERAYRAARAKLDELMDLAKTKPEAEKQQAAEFDRVQELSAKIKETEAARLIPENMDWGS